MSAPEFLPGILDGTMHRLENGRRTGVMWGPSVEGNWYASRSQVAGGETFKFTEWKFADMFLRADIGPAGRVFSGHIRYAPVTERGKSTTIWEHERPDGEAFMTEPCHCTEGEKRAT